MRNITLVLAIAIGLSLAHDGSLRAGGDDQQGDNSERVRQDGNLLTVSTDIRSNVPATTDDRARRAQLEPRCRTWVGYLERMGRGAGEVQVNQDSVDRGCQEDAKRSDERTQGGRLTVEMVLPRGRSVVENQARRSEFRATNRYESWVQCHRAAAHVVKAVAAVCDEATNKQKDNYVTALRIFEFVQQ